jgi:uncharacterized SAM-dependent methyltransferase
MDMRPVAQVTIHRSQFPAAIRQELLDSLRRRQIDHKFLYDGVKQTEKWLALHRAFSPSRIDPDCASTYDCSFHDVLAAVEPSILHLVGLGCGGGQKDTRLLRLLATRGAQVFYTPSDVSAAMVLVAREAALEIIPPTDCSPLVCDLAKSDDLPTVLDSLVAAEYPRLVTFFGMIPNFEPDAILPRLAALIRPGDLLLFSANLAPGADYSEGLKEILPSYDNDLTRDWLLSFLLDLGLERGDGELQFVIEAGPEDSELKRVAAYFTFTKRRELRVYEQTFAFAPRDQIRVFFSYRHTPALVRRLLGKCGLAVRREWLTRSHEEGVFLVARG